MIKTVCFGLLFLNGSFAFSSEQAKISSFLEIDQSLYRMESTVLIDRHWQDLELPLSRVQLVKRVQYNGQIDFYCQTHLLRKNVGNILLEVFDAEQHRVGRVSKPIDLHVIFETRTHSETAVCRPYILANVKKVVLLEWEALKMEIPRMGRLHVQPLNKVVARDMTSPQNIRYGAFFKSELKRIGDTTSYKIASTNGLVDLANYDGWPSYDQMLSKIVDYSVNFYGPTREHISGSGQDTVLDLQ